MSVNINIVLISGAICSGKSTLANEFERKVGAKVLKTRDLILERVPNVNNNREVLQCVGQKLDSNDKGQWVADALQDAICSQSSSELISSLIVVDAVRAQGQVEAIRNTIADASLYHIHLTAPPNELEWRYKRRQKLGDCGLEYKKIACDAVETNIEKLSDSADSIVNTGVVCVDQVFDQVASSIAWA